MSINLSDLKNPDKFSEYLRRNFKDGISSEDVQDEEILLTYIAKNSKKGVINKSDISDPVKLCNFINRITG